MKMFFLRGEIGGETHEDIETYTAVDVQKVLIFIMSLFQYHKSSERWLRCNVSLQYNCMQGVQGTPGNKTFISSQPRYGGLFSTATDSVSFKPLYITTINSLVH